MTKLSKIASKLLDKGEVELAREVLAFEEKVFYSKEAVWKEFPEAVIVDGTDDWYAQSIARPAQFDSLFGISILAYFHAGLSGISHSGIVVDKKNFDKLKQAYQKFGDIEKILRVYRK